MSLIVKPLMFQVLRCIDYGEFLAYWAHCEEC